MSSAPDPHLPPAPAPSTGADVLDGWWPRFGRGPLLASLRHGLTGRGVVLVGPPGVGKTVLAEEAVPRPAGHLVGAPGTERRPLWSIRMLAPDAASLDDAAADATQALRKAHRGAGPPVLRVDDLDHLDDASLAVVARLALGGDARVVATRRPGGARGAVSSLWREVGLLRIEVPSLDEDDTAALVRLALRGMVDGRASAAVWALSGGNPQVVRDVVVASVRAGALHCVDGFWRFLGEPRIGGTTGERVIARVGALDPARRGAVEALALTGPVPLALAERIVPAGILEELEREGLVSIDPAADHPAVRLADLAVSAVVIERLPVVARRRLAAAATHAFDEHRHDPGVVAPDLALRAAVWRVDAGGPVRSEELVAAARLAVDERDTVLGERLAGLAVAAGGGAEAVLLQSWCADEHGATRSSERALAEYVPANDAERIALGIRRAEQHHWIKRDPDAAQRILLETAAAVVAPWDLATTAQAAVFAVLDGRPDEAMDLAEDLTTHVTPQIGSTASLAVTLALAMADRPVEAERVAEEALASLDGATDALFIDPGVHIIGLLFALQGQGRLVEAEQLVTDVYRHTLTVPGQQAQGWAAMLRAYVLLARGYPTAAAEAAQEAELVWDSALLQGTARWSATIAALAWAEAGDLRGVEQALGRVERRDPAGFELFGPEVLRARAWRTHLAGGDPVPELEAAAALAHERGLAVLAAAAGHDLVRLGHPDRAVPVLAPLDSQSAVTRVRAELAGAAAAGDPDVLDAAGAAFAAMGALGWAGEARALAAAADPARSGSLRPAIAALLAETHLATPPLVAVAADPSPEPASGLTARELEVSRLAAEGYSNRDIAERLVVSVRTVENHLHRAFAKLGVTSRSELVGRLASA
jgi:DNA-binding NarL/FixJ family response regulator